MKRLISTLLALIPLAAAAQENTLPTQESIPAADRPANVKKGWNFGPLPAVGYNSDLGFQLGALCDIYYYGDGSVYPDYLHKFNVEASYYFRGSGIFHLFYDSKYLIPKGIRTTFAATYLPNPMMSFYGFNGASSPWYEGFDKQDGTAFYSMERNTLRILADFQGKIAGNLSWAAGASFWNNKIGSVKLEKYGEDADFSLYNLYRKHGIISANEAGGGSRLEFKAGLVFDTRDHEAAPSHGIWAEAVAYGSPDIFRPKSSGENSNGANDRYDYVKVAAHFRHYVPLSGDKIVFAYHLGYQGTVWGNVPFHMQSNITTPYLRQVHSEGLGGINTLRGMLYNRIVGDGVAWANAEVRFRIVSFNFISQQWYVALNPFFDAGAVVQPFRLERMREVWNDTAIQGEERMLIYSGLDEQFHMSAGMGVKLAMNRNFIISVEWAKPFCRQDGTNGLNIGLNYIF